MYGDKITQSVAEAVRKVMEGELKGNQHKLDVAEPKGKLTSADFKKLRGEAKVDERAADTEFSAGREMKASSNDQKPDPRKVERGELDFTAKKPAVKEGIEDRIEAARERARAAGKPMREPEKAKPSAVRTVAGKAYGGAAQKDEPESDDDTPQQPAKRGRGRPKGSTNKRRFNTKLYKESFSGMLEIYSQGGVKELFEDFAARTIEEEPDNEQFTKEVEAAKAKDRGEGEKAEVAKPAVQAVKQEEIEVFDANEVNGVTIETINEESEQIDEVFYTVHAHDEKDRSSFQGSPTKFFSSAVAKSLEHTKKGRNVTVKSHDHKGEIDSVKIKAGEHAKNKILNLAKERKKVNEESEQIDEISTEKMSSYYEKRRSQLSSGPKTWELQGKGKLGKAISGARTARDKLLARAKTNEAKQIKEFNPVAAVAGTGPKVIGGVAKFGASHSPVGQVAGSMSAKQEQQHDEAEQGELNEISAALAKRAAAKAYSRANDQAETGTAAAARAYRAQGDRLSAKASDRRTKEILSPAKYKRLKKEEGKKMNENPALAALAPAAGRALASGAGSALAGAAMNKMSGSAGAQKEGIKERTLTPAESKKKEEVVKSMKKKLSGFRERYGKRAKEVMYATATKVAKGEK